MGDFKTVLEKDFDPKLVTRGMLINSIRSMLNAAEQGEGVVTLSFFDVQFDVDFDSGEITIYNDVDDLVLPDGIHEGHLKFLDDLREVGANSSLLGTASAIMNYFGVNKKQANIILKFWMESYGERHKNAK